MDVYIDNDAAELVGSTLGDLLEAARKQLDSEGRLVVEVRVDGQTLTGTQFEESCEQPVDAEEVQFITAQPHELAKQTLLDVKDALADAREAQEQAAELLQSDRAVEAMDHVRVALTIWQQAQQSLLQSAQLLNVPLDEMKVGERGVADIIDELTELLNQVRDQLTGGDHVGLADTLAYPLADALDGWSALIDVMCERITAMKDGV